MDELITEFLAETVESIQELDNALISLEQNPSDKDLLSQIFRVMHTIKGTSGFLDLPRLGRIAHQSEDLLGLFREGQLKPSAEYVSLILESVDIIKIILNELESSGHEPEGADDDLIARLAAASAGQAIPDMILSGADISSTAPSIPDTSTETAPSTSASGESAISAQSLRVSVDVLEDLMTMVSELVLTRNQILQIARTHGDTSLSSSLQRLNHIVSDLQEGVMKTRMQPVGNAWAKLPRIVRDIAVELGKKIELDMAGQDTELDRQVLELIRDPLTHMVRNSADHGIEPPDVRVAAGKNETGHIKLNSYHEGGYIIITISDDGRGLPLEKIRQKIIQNKLATEPELAVMSETQIQQFIFHAGFSTADKITSVSGRGVGMDVVRSNIEKIGGSIEMLSTEGRGTTFTIKIPLTLAIVSALIVGIGDERFAIPQLDVRELVMISDHSAHKIEIINNAPVLRLRGRLLPLIGAAKLLGLPAPADNGRPKYVAVIRVGTTNYGLIVDRVFDTEEIVVKPVSTLLRNQPVFSGNTILGDGQVIMILDPAGIMKSSHIQPHGAAQGTAEDINHAQSAEDKKGAEEPLLLFMAGDSTVKAVPLRHVSRLEEIDLAQIEYAGGQRVVQYRQTLIPIRLYDESETLPAHGKRPVIVFSTRGGLSGMMVEKILDISAFHGEYNIKSEGFLAGSAIIQGKATDIVNLAREQGLDEWTSPPPYGAPHSNGLHHNGSAGYV